jgi:hypothetical protein
LARFNNPLFFIFLAVKPSRKIVWICTSSFVYNYGLGIKRETDVKQQESNETIPGPGDIGTIKVIVIPRPRSYQNLVRP